MEEQILFTSVTDPTHSCYSLGFSIPLSPPPFLYLISCLWKRGGRIKGTVCVLYGLLLLPCGKRVYPTAQAV